MFRKILIANRGEIARRVLRTFRRLGIASVAVYSEADAKAAFVEEADEAILIGPPPAAESYLRAERILDAARRTGAEAIHPGYGFLSENPGFVRACDDAGLVFIGPSPATMEALGDKQAARAAMSKAGLPVIPGSGGNVSGEEEARAAAEAVGYPVMVKASYGGGGIGMTAVETPEKLSKALRKASERAERSFGRGEIYIEKIITPTHHIEFQVLGDAAGRVATLFERECSVQRRQQKVIEESPSPFLGETLRAEMSERIARAAAAVGYRNAGTFECLVDAAGRWYFLEINMRLQVEHPVTETVTGLDLVEQQIRIASGESLSPEVLSAKSRGHAVEARLYAEDPAHKFLPQPGRIEVLEYPDREGLRVDGGVRAGDEITPFYDPLIAKIVACGTDRDEARERLAEALSATRIEGIATNRGFLARALRHPVFAAGRYTTSFVDENLAQLIT